MMPDDGGPPVMERCSQCSGRGYVRRPHWKKDGTWSKLAQRLTCPTCAGKKRLPEGLEDAWRERHGRTLH